MIIMNLSVIIQNVWSFTNEVVADLKEVFMLFDKDEDGVLTFSELEVVMKCLGHRTSGMIPPSLSGNDMIPPSLVR